MTLRDLIVAHPTLFYAQSWYAGEPFVDHESTGSAPRDFVVFPAPVKPFADPVHAVDLAALYVTCPADPRWRRFLWTDDYDSHGQRVYVGGVGQYGIEAFQIHRHLTIDERWGWVS